MSKTKFGVGVAGCGVIGSRRALVAANSENCRVAAVSDRLPSRMDELAAETGAEAVAEWEDMVERDDVDIVIVSTSNNFLAPISLAALNAGKHVLCEKPMCVNSHEAKELSAAVKESGCYLEVGYNHRYHPAVKMAYSLYREGSLGELMYMRCRYGHGGRRGYEKEWRMDPEFSGGGELLDQGVHAIDLFRWFLGDFTEAVGMTENWVWKSQVEDNAFALFRTSSGKVATLHASWTQWKNLFCLEIFGDSGSVEVDGLGGSYGTEKLTFHERNKEGGPPKIEKGEFEGKDTSWKEQWDDFLEAVSSGRSSMAAGVEDGLAVIQLTDAVYGSSQAGFGIKS